MGFADIIYTSHQDEDGSLYGNAIISPYQVESSCAFIENISRKPLQNGKNCAILYKILYNKWCTSIIGANTAENNGERG